MKKIYDTSFMTDDELFEYEASIVEDWPPEIQSLKDKGIIHVTYDDDYKPIFSLTELGKSVLRNIDPNLN